MKFLHDLLLFLAVRKIEDDLLAHKKGVFVMRDSRGGYYEAFRFRWRGQVYECDFDRARRDGALAALNYEINRQCVISEMTPRDWAEL